ncbi:MAG: hypothetical protein IH964_12640 [Candidatus Dadabacteria bacterium]|nr:hypothetical protein [Candidatus Dadabacteria bacterium]
MNRFSILMLVLVLGIAFSVAFSNSSFADKDKATSVKGNVICLIPNYEDGTVSPVIATAPCDGYPAHQHVVVTDSVVYSLQGLQDGLMKIQQSSNRTNVTVAGKIKGSEQTGWVLFVN